MILQFSHGSGSESLNPEVDNIYEAKVYMEGIYGPVSFKIQVWDRDGKRYLRGWGVDEQGRGSEQFA